MTNFRVSERNSRPPKGWGRIDTFDHADALASSVFRWLIISYSGTYFSDAWGRRPDSAIVTRHSVQKLDAKNRLFRYGLLGLYFSRCEDRWRLGRASVLTVISPVERGQPCGR
jgi:hypothetical protein